MSFFESYESIPAITKLLPEDRYEAFKRAHSELKQASPEYRKRCRLYAASVFLIVFIGIAPLPFVFTNGAAMIFVSVWSTIGVIPLFLISSQYQKMRIDEIDSYLRKSEG
jgi:hypothetical protein